MDTKFKSSFIPKTSFTGKSESEPSFGLFSGLAILVFILGFAFTAGAFFYKIMLRNEVDNLKSQLVSAEASIDKDAIKEVMLFDRRIKSIKDILKNHVASTKYFEMLEENTASQVQFVDLKYNFLSDGNIAIEMDGSATSYAVVALQEDVFLKNPYTMNASFNNLRSDKKDGTVSFSFKGEFKGDLVKFRLPENYVSTIPTTLENDSEDKDEVLNVLDDLSGLENFEDI